MSANQPGEHTITFRYSTILNTPVPDTLEPDFVKAITAVNFHRLKILCIGLICLGTALFIIDYRMLSSQPTDALHIFYPYYLRSDLTLALLNGLIYLAVAIAKKRGHPTLDQGILIFTTVSLLAWCGAVGALEYFTHQSVSTLIIGIFFLSTSLYLNGWLVISAMAAGLLSFICVKATLGPGAVHFIPAHVNLLGLTLFGWLLSRILYRHKLSSFVSQQQLSRKNLELAREIQTRKAVEEDLKQAHQELEYKVFQRTKALADANRRLQSEIREREKMEASLRQAQKMESIGTLAGGIAHDFNNILSPILGHADMLMSDIPKDSPHWASLQAIADASVRARDLVRQILTFARQENYDLTLFNAQTVIEEVLKLLRSSLPSSITIKKEIDPDCGVIRANPTHIHQILMNLATNAYHAMQDTGGELKVSLTQTAITENNAYFPGLAPGTYVCLTVADTGAGMTDEVKEKIFDPFFSTKDPTKGTGMGLSVVHGIVKGIGGAVQVESSPGKGTQFRVYFPMEKGDAEDTSPHLDADKLTGGTETILLVDD
ncbi:MAG: ATP-binding protein, partial [Desulfobacterales bacterium]|nr:ATP-binding protein [Desulfobacterales bacterium]